MSTDTRAVYFIGRRLLWGAASASPVVAVSLVAHLPHVWPGALFSFCVGYAASFILWPRRARS